MLDELLAGRLPSELGDLVVERAEGNPFFVEELLGVLIDRGLLARDDGGWVLRELPSEFAVPDSVHAVLAARIDLLGAAEKAALQAAAVIGRVFWTGPVYELESEPDLRVLEDRDLVRRRAGSPHGSSSEGRPAMSSHLCSRITTRRRYDRRTRTSPGREKRRNSSACAQKHSSGSSTPPSSQSAATRSTTRSPF
jgi:hypothetical protein